MARVAVAGAVFLCHFFSDGVRLAEGKPGARAQGIKLGSLHLRGTR